MIAKAAGLLTSTRALSSATPSVQRKHLSFPGRFSLVMYSILQGAHSRFILIPQKHIVFPMIRQGLHSEVEQEHMEAARTGGLLPGHHLHFFRQLVCLFQVAVYTGGYDVRPFGDAAPRSRDHMIAGEVFRLEPLPAILARVIVPEKDVLPRKPHAHVIIPDESP